MTDIKVQSSFMVQDCAGMYEWFPNMCLCVCVWSLIDEVLDGSNSICFFWTDLHTDIQYVL